MAFFYFKTCSYRIFLVRVRILQLIIDPNTKLQFNWTKDKGTRIWHRTIPKTAWWRHSYLLVMTSAEFLWLLRDIVQEYNHAKFGCNWTTNKGETEGGRGEAQCPPAYMVPKDPSLNRVNRDDVINVPELSSNQEEEDTKLCLHARHALNSADCDCKKSFCRCWH